MTVDTTVSTPPEIIPTEEPEPSSSESKSIEKVEEEEEQEEGDLDVSYTDNVREQITVLGSSRVNYFMLFQSRNSFR